MGNHSGYLIFSIELGISERVTRVTIVFYKRRQGVTFLWKMWLLVLLVIKCTNFLLEARILHGYALVSRWLLAGYSFILCCSFSMQLLTRYPLKEDTDLNKNSGILSERCYFFLRLWSMCQMFVSVLFNTEPCINNVYIDM